MERIRRLRFRASGPSIKECPLGVSGLLAMVAWTCLAVFLGHGTATAEGIPEPPQISLEPADSMNGLFLAPGDGALTLHVEALTSTGQPITFAPVTFEVPEEIRFCFGSPPPAATDHNGRAEIVLRGGGCFTGAFGVRVKISGVTVRDYPNARSPDFDGVSADGRLSLPDLISFTGEFLGTSGGLCHDYDDDGNTGIEDLVLFVPSFLNGDECVLH